MRQRTTVDPAEQHVDAARVSQVIRMWTHMQMNTCEIAIRVYGSRDFEAIVDLIVTQYLDAKAKDKTCCSSPEFSPP